MKDSFKNRRGNVVVLKRPLSGGESLIVAYPAASLRRLKTAIAQLRLEQKKNDSRASKRPNLDSSDEWFEQWKADNENNLIDLEKS